MPHVLISIPVYRKFQFQHSFRTICVFIAIHSSIWIETSLVNESFRSQFYPFYAHFSSEVDLQNLLSVVNTAIGLRIEEKSS